MVFSHLSSLAVELLVCPFFFHRHISNVTFQPLYWLVKNEHLNFVLHRLILVNPKSRGRHVFEAAAAFIPSSSSVSVLPNVAQKKTRNILWWLTSNPAWIPYFCGSPAFWNCLKTITLERHHKSNQTDSPLSVKCPTDHGSLEEWWVCWE